MSIEETTAFIPLDVASMLLSHSLAHAVTALAEYQSATGRAEAAAMVHKICSSDRFVITSYDSPVSIVASDWTCPIDTLYHTLTDAMDGKVPKRKPSLCAAHLYVRRGLTAVVLQALADVGERSKPLSAETIYSTYMSHALDMHDGQTKPFAKTSKPVRRAWFALATAIARILGQEDPEWGDSGGEVLWAMALVNERFGPPKSRAA